MCSGFLEKAMGGECKRRTKHLIFAKRQRRLATASTVWAGVACARLPLHVCLAEHIWHWSVPVSNLEPNRDPNDSSWTYEVATLPVRRQSVLPRGTASNTSLVQEFIEDIVQHLWR